MMAETIENGNGDKSGAEHLRALRDIFNPLIQRFVTEYKAPDRFYWETILSDEDEYDHKGKISPNWSNAILALHNNFADEKGKISSKIWSTLEFSFYPSETAYPTYLLSNNLTDTPDTKAEFESNWVRLKRIMHEVGVDSHTPKMRKGVRDHDSKDTFDFDHAAQVKRELAGYMHHNAIQVIRKHKDANVSTPFFWQNFMEMRSSPYIVWGRAASEPDAFPPFLVLQGSAYGPRFTQKLFTATQALLTEMSSDMHMDQTRYRITEEEKRTIHHTARWEMDKDRSRPEESSARRTLSEGIVSLGQSLALLTAQRVGGYSDSNKLVEALITHGLPTQLAQEIPPAIIGTFALSGKYIPGLVKADTAGNLSLNEKIIKMWREDKLAIRRKEIVLGDFERMPAAGRGCPVSFKDARSGIAGLQQLSCLFLQEFQSTPVQTLSVPRES